MNSTAHVRPESEISLEQGVCCAVWGRQTTMQMRANQFLARIQSCSQHAVDSQSTTTAKDPQNQYKIKILYRSTCTVQLQDTRFIYEYSISCTMPIRTSPQGVPVRATHSVTYRSSDEFSLDSADQRQSISIFFFFFS